MMLFVNYTQTLLQLTELLHRVTYDREIVIIQREGEEDVVMIAAAELTSLLETAYLLRSPSNAKRLFSALHRATEPQSTP